MDDFSIFCDSFDTCLEYLGKVLECCIETNLVMNWEKFHFIVKEGVMLMHKILGRGIQVDQAKVEVIAKLPPLIPMRSFRSFLGHAKFNR